MDRNQVITASRLNSLAKCARQHYWRYEVGLRYSEISNALVIGSAWARALESYWKTGDYDTALQCAIPDNVTVDEISGAKVGGLLAGYIRYWGGDQFIKEIYPEQRIGPIPLGFGDFMIDGVMDGIGLTSNDRVVMVESKTTADSLEDDSDYWLRLRFNIQLLQYVPAAWSHGWNVETVIYDVTRKPAIKPKVIPVLDKDGLKIVNDAGGNRVKLKNGKWRTGGSKTLGLTVKAERETPGQFATRLAEDCTERPEFYFARREVPIIDDDLEWFSIYRRQQVQLILHYRFMERTVKRPEDAWPTNISKECRYCQFSSFCLQGIKIDANNPPEHFLTQQFNPELKRHDNQDTNEDDGAAAE